MEKLNEPEEGKAAAQEFLLMILKGGGEDEGMRLSWPSELGFRTAALFSGKLKLKLKPKSSCPTIIF